MKKITIAAAIASLFVTAAVAQEGPQCSPTEFAEDMHRQNGDVRRVIGLLDNGTMLSIWESMEGYFALVISGPEGISCLVGVGEALQVVADRPRQRPNL